MSNASANVLKLVAECITQLETVLEAQHDVREDKQVREDDAAQAAAAAAAAAASQQQQQEQQAADGEVVVPTPPPPPPPPPPAADPNADAKPSPQVLNDRLNTATEAATKTLHRLLVHSIHSNDCLELCRTANFLALLERIADVVGVGHDDHVLRQVGMDVNFAANAISMVANLCVFEDVRNIFPAPDLAVSIALTAIRHQPSNKRVVHLCLTCVSNVALCGDLPLLRDAAEALTSAVVPIFDEAPVVEAWACAMCNVAATTVHNLHLLVACGAVKRLEALLQYHADNERVVARGFQCLSCLCAAHFGPRATVPTTTGAAAGPTIVAAPAS